jgi:hypothetical protein
VSVVGVSMEMLGGHGHNDTALGSDVCCPRPSNSFPPSRIGALCALAVAGVRHLARGLVEWWNAPPAVLVSVRLSVAAVRHGRGGHSSETASAREGEALEGSQAAHQVDDGGRQSRPAACRLSVGSNFLAVGAKQQSSNRVRAYL